MGELPGCRINTAELDCAFPVVKIDVGVLWKTISQREGAYLVSQVCEPQLGVRFVQQHKWYLRRGGSPEHGELGHTPKP